MIDTHCHVDLFPEPLQTCRKLSKDLSECVAVTMLPSHFEVGQHHIKPFKGIKAALGLHPLRAHEAKREIKKFVSLARNCEFIGEVGLDGSMEGRASLALQKELFTEAISAFAMGTFVTVHSRAAWQDTLNLLRTQSVGPVCFHYCTGGQEAVDEILAQGHFLSVNIRMIEPMSRHRSIVAELPKDRVLVESDAPFLSKTDATSQIAAVYKFFAEIWHLDSYRVNQLVEDNFRRCRIAKRRGPHAP